MKKDSPASSPVTIRFLAEQTGYSVGTVSSVLNNRSVERQISPKATQRIRETALKFRYVPNMAARRLRANRSESNQVILAIISSTESPASVLSPPINALNRLISNRNDTATSYTLAVEMFQPGRLCDLPGLLDVNRFSGAIITNLSETDAEFLESAFIPFPIVVVNRRIPGFSCVSEELGAGRLAAETLFSINRMRPAIVRPSQMTYNTSQRLNSFRKAVIGHLGSEPLDIVSVHGDEQSAAEATLRVLTQHKVDGLFAVHDSLAIGACHAIENLKRKIPDDVAVIGVGDSEISLFMRPPLSTIGVDHRGLHHEAASILIGILDQEITSPIHRELPLQVTLRESTGHISA